MHLCMYIMSWFFIHNTYIYIYIYIYIFINIHIHMCIQHVLFQCDDIILIFHTCAVVSFDSHPVHLFWHCSLQDTESRLYSR